MRELTEWNLRPNTQDEFIVNEVYVSNCYQIDEDLTGKIIVDIGANIGAFTALCLECGAEYVYAVEMDSENCRRVEQNLRDSSRWQGYHRAAVPDSYSGDTIAMPVLSLDGGADVLQTGGKSLFFSPRRLYEYVPVIRISDVLATARSHGRPIILKLDCEGYEYSLLLSVAESELGFAGIESVVLECHELIDGRISLHGEELPAEIIPEIAQRMQSPEWVCALLEDHGFSTSVRRNPDDPHLSLVFADRKKTVVMLTPVRSARRYLPRFFKQVGALRDALKGKYRFRLVLAEGDSEDGTRERLLQFCQELNLDYELLDVSHGGMRWSSVEDPARMRAMSKIMNSALSAVKPSDDIVIWGMVDTEWNVEDILRLVDFSSHALKGIFAPAVYVRYKDDLYFYDTWAYRTLEGQRFNPKSLFEGFERGRLYSIESAGTCLVMSADIARTCRASDQEAVSFCADARSNGFHITLVSQSVVFHSEPPQRRILWIGDALVHTGFGRVTHSVLPRLSESGFDIDIIGLNYYGAPHNLPYRIWPAAQRFNQDPRGVLRMKQLICSSAYEAVVVLCDPWNVKLYQEALESLRETVTVLPVLIPWLTVDSLNIDWSEIKNCRESLYCSSFAAMHHPVVSYGVDANIFHPLDREESREFSLVGDNIPRDAYIVGYVGTNQYRKRLDLTLQAFAQWVRTRKVDAYLYLYISGSAAGGFDIEKLAAYFGISERVTLISVGYDVSDAQLAKVYSSFDVYLCTSQAEGFGLTLLEAMACGVPVITSSQGGRTWIPSHCAKVLPATEINVSAPLDGLMYTIGATPSVDSIVGALSLLYEFPSIREGLSWEGLKLAQTLSWENSGATLAESLTKILEELACSKD